MVAKILTLSVLSFIYFVSIVYSLNIEISNGNDACSKICQNGAKCTKMAKYEFCKCLPGTFGDDCGIVPDCIDEVIKCNEKSNSVCGYNVQLKEAECICDNSNLAYDRSTETCRATCNETKTCKNGGTCKGLGNYKFCDCIPGTFGDTCESITSCVEETLVCKIESGADCGFNILEKRPECLCYDGLKYDPLNESCRETCDVKKLCENGGVCTKFGHYSFCECISGTTGPTCGDVTSCEDGSQTCKSDAKCGFNVAYERAECLCESGLKYDNVNEICRETCDEKKICENGGACTKLGHYSFCECIPGTSGPTCGDVTSCKDGSLNCKVESESHCGFNEKDKRAECLCKLGLKYDTVNGTCRETCNEENICENGGICTKLGHYSFCECIQGTTGQTCREITECNNAIVLCGIESGAECGFNIKDKRAECLCESGLKYDILSETCRATCNENKTCENGGTCRAASNYEFCDCLIGTYGDTCEHVTFCIKEKLICNPVSGAVCGFSVLYKQAECLCSNGLKYDLRLQQCRETCKTGYDCENGASCLEINYYSFCVCNPGTYGDKCEIVTDCKNKLTCKEESGAKCGYNFHLDVAECICDNDLKYDPSNGECREWCHSNDVCLQGSRCARSGNYQFCDCLPGTDGHRCESVTDCDNHKLTCNNGSGATCGYNRNLNASECICNGDLKYDIENESCRETCNTREDCKNGAVCKSIGIYYFCDCRNGTYGHKCEKVTECDNNSGMCMEESGSTCGFNIKLNVTECICYNDLKYDTETEACRETCYTKRDCKNGAACKITGNYYFCECRNGTYGHRCEKVTECDNNSVMCKEESGAICGYNLNLNVAECMCHNNLKYDIETETCKEPCSDCQNGGVCIGNNAFCECRIGTYGEKCEKLIGCEYKLVTCRERSGATCGYNIDFNVTECLCPNDLKYDTEIGACRETCEDYNDCQNGAICAGTDYNFCQCPYGTFGHYCENVTDCHSNTITCNKDSGAVCGYNPILEVADCLCKNGLKYDWDSGTCRVLGSSTTGASTSTKHHTASAFPTKATTDVGKTRQPFLTSTAAYVNKCNSNPAICPKLSTECVPIGNDYYCKCKTGFRLKTGAVKEYNKKPCIKKKCDCGINSYNCQWSVEGRKICSCFLGYSQVKGVCTDCNCGMNSLACVFDDKGRKLCGCKTGYFQRNDTCSEMCTNDKDCLNSGVCQFENNGYFCKCKSPFKGDRCEINEACEHLSNTCHTIGAICQYIESSRKGVCVCPLNRYFDDKSNMCEDKYESDSSWIIVLSLSSGFLLISTIILIIVFNKFRSRSSMK